MESKPRKNDSRKGMKLLKKLRGRNVSFLCLRTERRMSRKMNHLSCKKKSTPRKSPVYPILDQAVKYESTTRNKKHVAYRSREKILLSEVKS